MTSSQGNNINTGFDSEFYRLYWKLCLEDILAHLGAENTKENKKLLHNFHKRVLGYDSTSGRSSKVLSRFLNDVIILWAEQGIFVRTSGRQPKGIEDMDLCDVWGLL